MSETTNVTLLGRTFALKTQPDKAKTLKESAQYLHNHMVKLGQNAHHKEFEGLLVISALNIIANLGEKLESLQKQLAEQNAASKQLQPNNNTAQRPAASTTVANAPRQQTAAATATPALADDCLERIQAKILAALNSTSQPNR